MIDLNKKAKEIHVNNVKVGWWDNDPCIYEKLQLVSTEIAEATEGERKGLMDDHLPHRKMGEVELADALIRILDIGGRLNLEHQSHCLDAIFISEKIAGKHMKLNCMLATVCEEITNQDARIEINYFYTEFINGLITVSYTHGYDIFSAMEEKLEYNKHRPDHKRGNRAKIGGKKF